MRVDLGRRRRRGRRGPSGSTTPSRPSSTPRCGTRSSASDDVLELGRDDFPLPTLHARLLGIEEELINGRGFVRLRGIDRRAYTQTEMEILYWGIGTHLGLPWAQNKHGHVLGDVTDQDKGDRRPDRPRQRARRHRPAVPLRRLRPRRADVPRERSQRRAVGGRQLGAHPQPARRGAARPRRRSVRRAARTTSGASSRRAASRTTWCRCSPSGTAGCSCAASRRTSGPRSATPRRPG